MKKVFDILAQWAALISGSFFFIGIIRAILYYLPFRIPIHTYIDLSEVFTIWFPDTVFSLIFPMIFSLLIGFIYHVKHTDNREFYYYHFVIYLVHIACIVFLFANLIFNLSGSHSPEKMDFIRPYWIMLAIVSLLGFPFMVRGIVRLLSFLRRPIHSNLTNMFRLDAIANMAFIMFYIFCYLIYDPLATDITSKHTNERIELIRSEQDKVITDDNVRYLGKTRNYIFLWNKKSRNAEVYKAEQFNEIRIGRN